LAISFALPTCAQQRDLANPQTTHEMLAMQKAIDEAISNRDAAAIAALYMGHAVMVTTVGPFTDRQAIQKWWTELFQ
jgi:ketosteroid isomerase-like protein